MRRMPPEASKPSFQIAFLLESEAFLLDERNHATNTKFSIAVLRELRKADNVQAGVSRPRSAWRGKEIEDLLALNLDCICLNTSAQPI
mmetsp:Transcript_78401/g.138988  ORF Transcript_78401/g.138988 Transcript_78401/m.138988 type:complete len:88 (+) Transcript_78401:734-997(+)